MEAGRWKQVAFIWLIAVSCLVFALFSGQNYDFIRRDASPLPTMARQVIRRWEGDHGYNATFESSVEDEHDEHSLTINVLNETHEPSNLGSKQTCFRQVQVWRGSKNPQKPQDFECPGLDCGIRFVQDKSYETMKKSDAVVLFHRTKWDWDEMVRRRPSNQVWAFFSLESPLHTIKNAIPPKKYQYVYNYTISYRPSSTIYGPYGIYDTTVPQVSPDDDRNWAQDKTGMAVWMASNCADSSWKRYGFVKKLSKLMKVDIYGGCGNLRCSRDTNDCWNRISKYKFYLAVENSECRDYITEKFWKNSLEHDVVPIVYGAPKKDYLQVAPPNSFIHLQDFKSMGDLTDYLNLLNSNDTLYNSYFEWKRHGIVRRVARKIILSPPYLCKVVSKMLDDERDIYNGNIQEGDMVVDVNNWWTKSCFKPSGFPHNF